ncbi:aminomethyl-transferring glycine dehydrogenase [Pseudokineococcus marinus]|uniref:Glycine dehydrogenase (decarboxylating) n=1 Tax=Pseudokineococcus marinus TaxID=351215 RepID=A0A849BMI9_9ACTN|nr:aminomethyl-transferring glycine dehydrogenase [Pseudokineococcus marinus]NNH22563.1 aminomethyl-transferring glycine dehydrogenase [Pseudokineococcus marinus]
MTLPVDPQPADHQPADHQPADDQLADLRPGTSGAAPFADRHVGPSADDVRRMLALVGQPSLEALVDAAVPAGIRTHRPLDLPAAGSEREVTERLRALADRNTVRRSMIGLGYSGTVLPPVIRRNVLEDPSWYTAYTPYQPEISQGRLEALLNFQTVVADLTGLALANASMLDEATAAAEAMTLVRRASRAPRDAAFVVDADVLPQTLAVLRTRAEAIGMRVVVHDTRDGLPEGDLFGLLLQQPGASGLVRDDEALVREAHDRGALVVVAADLLALTLLRPPGEVSADVAVGTSQRFGVPMGGGGPHAGYIAVREGLQRTLPGRLVGVSKDADGHPAYRLALQTREQHIRREKATSNICTAQVLLAVIASMYAVHHGPDGLRRIARTVHERTLDLGRALRARGLELVHADVFDTVLVRVPGRADEVVAAAREAGYWLRRVDGDVVGLTCDETTTPADVDAVVACFPAGPEPVGGPELGLPAALHRTSDYLTHPVFAVHRSETAMLRYLKRLSDADYALDRGMIPLGSCTMKLNATAEMEPISWPAFADVHPFAPAEDLAGTRALAAELESQLAEVTGYDAVSLQPNAGSQGELAGLLAIRAYHRSRGDEARDVCLIPTSAHGTNAASAVMAGLRVVTVATTGTGDVDLEDLDAKIAQHGERLAAVMVTYPSTHGVFEAGITRVCEAVHAAGGQVYVDGANLNALVGVAKPGEFGADVSHLNLHKTFCIPHGGGGPGVGPVAARAHLAPFLPAADVTGGTSAGTSDAGGTGPGGVGPVSGAPLGSAGILPISWTYLALMGPDGLLRATQAALLTANYVAARLREHYPVLYTGEGGLVAHECILDLRPLTAATGVTVDDVAKRLVDFGFHAPTMSFPVAGTLMVEPTESEDLAELDRFCDAMVAIRAEVAEVEEGRWSVEDSPLRGAPHTAAMLVGEWDRPYDRSRAVYPAGVTPQRKYWPPVRRIDGAYGDRNLVCSCPPVEELAGL